ncbi:MAG: DUF6088 family protein [Bryobacterales bacterium]|nr:DUF6088 family protein [Bryobacterales bacterium]
MTMQTMKEQILRRIEKMPPGSVFSPKDFLDIASRGTADMTLASLLKEGRIRRIRRGLYDLPRNNPSLGGELSPDIDGAARAFARNHRWKIVPDKAWAANVLGISTQVPAKIIYLSDGPSKKLEIGRRTVFFKHARPSVLASLDSKAGLVVQAIRDIGKEHIGPAEIRKLRSQLSPAELRKLVKETRYSTAWISEIARQIAGEES